MKRGATTYSGILLVDKPAGMSSHDVVDRIRRLSGERRVGHAGTLDPMATGLLVVLIGPATRLSDYLMGHDKCYRARILFGVGTDTDDIEGRAIAMGPYPDWLLDEERVSQVVKDLVGEHQQVPPQYSAVKKEGKAAYVQARKGEKVDLVPRTIHIHQADFLGMGTLGHLPPDAVPETAPFEDERLSLPEQLVYWDLRLEVSKGTYIRSVARDLGEQLGVPACLASLNRTRIGGLRVESALDVQGMEALSAWGEAQVLGEEQWEHLFTDPVEALGFPSLVIDDDVFARVRNGAILDLSGQAAYPDGFPEQLSLVHQGRLVAIYQLDPSLGLRRSTPCTVLPGGVGGVRG